MNRSPDRRRRSPRNDSAATVDQRLRALLEPTESAVCRVSRAALARASSRRQHLRDGLFAGSLPSLSLTAGAVVLLLAVALVFPQQSAGPPRDLSVPPVREAVAAAPPRVTVVGSRRALLVAPAIASPSGRPRSANAVVTDSSEPGTSGSILLIRRRDS